MSKSYKSSCTASPIKDANNNTLHNAGPHQGSPYNGGPGQGYVSRGYTPPNVTSNGNYQQVTAKVLFGSVTKIKDLQRQDKFDKTEKKAQRTN